MNEKIRKYMYLKNDINLIDRKVPKESDLENFEKWKKRKRKKDLKFIIFSLSIIILIYGVLFATGVWLEADLKSKIFGILCLFIFMYCVYDRIKIYLNAKYWKMEYCDYGKVVDKYKRRTAKKHRDCYIIVKVNTNELKFNLRREGWLLNIGDDVIVFSIEGQEKIYVTKND